MTEAPTKYCYECDAPVKYLFSDGRCGKCTREELDVAEVDAAREEGVTDGR